MNKLPQRKVIKTKKAAIAFCALAALIPLTVIGVGLQKNNHRIVKLGFAGSVLVGMGIGMSFQNKKEHN